jgi:hypothetical protein
MQVADNTAVSIHYTLTNDAGEVLDTSIGDEPLIYLHGKGNIISGLEMHWSIKILMISLKYGLHLKMHMAKSWMIWSK